MVVCAWKVEYVATGKADDRLTEESEDERGCGGIGVLWHKSIGATPLTGFVL